METSRIHLLDTTRLELRYQGLLFHRCLSFIHDLPQQTGVDAILGLGTLTVLLDVLPDLVDVGLVLNLHLLSHPTRGLFMLLIHPAVDALHAPHVIDNRPRGLGRTLTEPHDERAQVQGDESTELSDLLLQVLLLVDEALDLM